MVDSNKDFLYLAVVNIENKRFLNDPEGETILNDLILKEGYHDVISVRSAKSLRIEIIAKDVGEAKLKVKDMCDSLRIYNPVVSECRITVKRKQKS